MSRTKMASKSQNKRPSGVPQRTQKSTGNSDSHPLQPKDSADTGKSQELGEALRNLHKYLVSLNEESKKGSTSVFSDEGLLNFHIGLVLKKSTGINPAHRQMVVEHCNFVYLTLMLLYRSKSFAQVKNVNSQNLKSTLYVMQNIVDNSLILAHSESKVQEKLPKFKQNLFGSIFEIRRVCNTSGLQHCLPLIK